MKQTKLSSIISFMLFASVCLLLTRRPIFAVCTSCQTRNQKKATSSSPSAFSSYQAVARVADFSSFNLRKLESLREKLETQKSKLEEKKEEKQEKFEEKLANKSKIKIESLFNNMHTRYENAIRKLDNIALRIESRIIKIEEADPSVSTEEIRDRLSDIRENTNELDNALQLAKTSMDEILSSEDPASNFELVADLLGELNEIERQ